MDVITLHFTFGNFRPYGDNSRLILQLRHQHNLLIGTDMH